MKKELVQKIAFTSITILSFTIVSVVLLILGFIVVKGIGAINIDFLTKAPENGMMDGGIFPAILGTLLLILGSAAIAFPVGILSGIYMNEYAANNWFKKFIGMMTNNLAGVPSIVFGLFGLAIFVNFLGFGVSILSGCLTLGILILPVIIRTTEESLKTIEDSYRQASLALGASKLQTTFSVVLPMAFPNIVTGLIISIGRVAGETAPIIFTCAAYYLPEIILSFQTPVMALPYHLYVMATSGVDLNASRKIAFGTALVLMTMVFILNLSAGAVKKYMSKK
ncbi:MAG: phosphate ABC transporter permease PstA [Cytophagales bacterium]|nr:phosphate ABC transporter permease PstA [Cytophagales bacterium]